MFLFRRGPYHNLPDIVMTIRGAFFVGLRNIGRAIAHLARAFDLFYIYANMSLHETYNVH
jgi:hypothetical protein